MASATSKSSAIGDTFEARLLGLLPALPPAERRVADVVLADPGGTAASTIGALAARCDTSPTTVTRFCRVLGLAGYAELRLTLAAEGARVASQARERAWAREAGGAIAPDDDLDTVLATLLRSDTRALEDTVAGLDRAALRRAVDALATARRTDLYAVSGSGAVATDFYLRLHRIGRTAHAWTDVHDALTSAALLGAADVAVAISHSGETREVVEPLALARQRGATTIAVTNYPRSSLAADADVVLTTAARETTFRSGGLAGRHAQMIVVDALYIGVAQHRFADSHRAFEVTAAAVASHHVARRRPPDRPLR